MKSKSDRQQRMDEIIDNAIDKALADFECLFPPDVLDEMRKLMGLMMDTDPDIQRALRRLVPPDETKESDKVDVHAFRDMAPSNGEDVASELGVDLELPSTKAGRE